MDNIMVWVLVVVVMLKQPHDRCVQTSRKDIRNSENKCFIQTETFVHRSTVYKCPSVDIQLKSTTVHWA